MPIIEKNTQNSDRAPFLPLNHLVPGNLLEIITVFDCMACKCIRKNIYELNSFLIEAPPVSAEETFFL